MSKGVIQVPFGLPNIIGHEPIAWLTSTNQVPRRSHGITQMRICFVQLGNDELGFCHREHNNTTGNETCQEEILAFSLLGETSGL